MMRTFLPFGLLALSLGGCSVLVNAELDDKPRSLAADAGTGADDGAVDTPDAGSPRADAGNTADTGTTPSQDAGSGSAANTGFQLVMGASHACALSPAGAVTCWGDNTYLQLDLPDGSYKQLAAGTYHTCGITAAGALVCAGRNDGGQRASAAGPFVSVAAGDSHTCALAADGKVSCFGEDVEGQSTPPSGVAFDTIAAGTAVSCGIVRDGHALRCWGRGRMGYESGAVGLALSAVAAGDAVLCVIEEGTGKPTCFGTSYYQAPDLRGVRAISAGIGVCAILEDGAIQCWGDDPPIVVEGGPYVAVGVGLYAACGVPADGPVRCTNYYSDIDSVSAMPPPNFP